MNQESEREAREVRENGTPLVSIVIPCYNAAPYLDRCLQHVAAQTYPNLEAICIDDGSQDNTLDLLHQYAERLKFPMRVLTGANAGAPVARNKGLEVAEGVYIQFLDADDVLKPEKIRHQVDLAEASTVPVDLVVGTYYRQLPSGEQLLHPLETEDVWVGLLHVRLGITSANLWRTSFARKIGGWDPTWPASQDAEFTFRTLRAGAEVQLDTEALTVKYELSTGINASNKERQLRYLFKSRRLILDHLRENNMLAKREARIDYDWMFSFFMQLYNHAPAEALELHDHIFPAWFVPKRKVRQRPALAPTYRMVYRALGFRKAQQMEQYWRRISRKFSRVMGR